MSETKEYTFSEVSGHNTKKVLRDRSTVLFAKMLIARVGVQDLFVVIHDKVYNATSFVDEHPYVLSSLLPSRPLPTRSR